MADQVKKKSSFQTLRKMFGKRVKSVAQSESKDSATHVDDFFAYYPGAEIRQTFQTNVSSPEPIRYTSTMSPVSEPVLTPASNSTISLDSTFSMGSNIGYMQPAPQPQQPVQRPRPRTVIDGPDDFNQFRSDLHPVELEWTPTPYKKLPHPPARSFEIDSIPFAAAPVEWTPAPYKKLPRPPAKSFEIDSTSVAAAQEPHKPKPPFKAFPGRPAETGRVKYQAYPGAAKRKPVQVRYVPPNLQSGYHDGVPPALRVRHSTANLHQPYPTQNDTSAAPQNYAYPLVNSQHGLFMNANMSDASITSRYQNPRIPSMRFPSRGLGDEVHAELAVRIPDEDDRPVSRAWMSPGSPIDFHAYEMEASMPGFSVETAKLAHYRPKTPAIITTVKKREPDISSPVSPPSSDAGKVPFKDYNWPRLGDLGTYHVDPAEAYSRSYRERRRERDSRREEREHQRYPDLF